MRSYVLVIGLLCSTALPSWAQDKKPPAPYFKLEIRGTLRVAKIAFGRFEPVKLVKQAAKGTIEASGVVMRLDFGEDKELAALAKTLDGKTVLVRGELRRATGKELTGYSPLDREPHLAVQPPHSKYPRLRFID